MPQTQENSLPHFRKIKCRFFGKSTCRLHLSTAAGFIYSGERFEKYFGDFAKRFGIQDMYSGGFYPFPDAETRWAWWARNIYINRYVPAPKPVYQNLLSLVKDNSRENSD